MSDGVSCVTTFSSVYMGCDDVVDVTVIYGLCVEGSVIATWIGKIVKICRNCCVLQIKLNRFLNQPI